MNDIISPTLLNKAMFPHIKSIITRVYLTPEIKKQFQDIEKMQLRDLELLTPDSAKYDRKSYGVTKIFIPWLCCYTDEQGNLYDSFTSNNHTDHFNNFR
jgi:hypothetical protein